MTAELLDTVVKLASAGSSGISIFAILWAGWLLKSLDAKAHENKHKTIIKFMIMCVVITLIASISGTTNAIYNANKINILSKKLESNEEEYKTQIESLYRKNAEYKEQIAATKKSINALLDVKQGIVGVLPNSEKFKTLKSVLIDIDKQLGIAIRDNSGSIAEDNTRNRVFDIIARELSVSRDKINDQISFEKDIGTDALDLYVLIDALEEEFHILIDTEQINTVGDVLQYVKKRR